MHFLKELINNVWGVFVSFFEIAIKCLLLGFVAWLTYHFLLFPLTHFDISYLETVGTFILIVTLKIVWHVQKTR